MRILCPMCKKQLDDVPDDYGPRPFCSARCKLADLDNWMSERYRIPGPASEEIPGPASEEDADGEHHLH